MLRTILPHDSAPSSIGWLAGLASTTCRSPGVAISLARWLGRCNDDVSGMKGTTRSRVALLAIVTLSFVTTLTREAHGQSIHVSHLEWSPAVGLHFLGPQRASLALGALGVFKSGN